MEKIKEGALVVGRVIITAKRVEGVLSYENYNPIITDKDGVKWLVERTSVIEWEWV